MTDEQNDKLREAHEAVERWADRRDAAWDEPCEGHERRQRWWDRLLRRERDLFFCSTPHRVVSGQIITLKNQSGEPTPGGEGWTDD